MYFASPGRCAPAVRPGRLCRGGLHDRGAGRGDPAAVEGRRRAGLFRALQRVSAQRLGCLVSPQGLTSLPAQIISISVSIKSHLLTD